MFLNSDPRVSTYDLLLNPLELCNCMVLRILSSKSLHVKYLVKKINRAYSFGKID